MSTLKEQIKKYMLKLISANDKKLTAKTMEAFSGRVSKSSLYNYPFIIYNDYKRLNWTVFKKKFKNRRYDYRLFYFNHLQSL